MKLLFVIDDLNSGGAQRQLTTLALELVKYNYKVHTLVYGVRDYYERVLTENKITVHKIIVRNPLKRIIRIRRFIRGGGFDTVFSFLGIPNFICELSSIPSKRWNLIVSERSADPKILKSLNSRFRRLFHIFSDAIICNSYSSQLIVKKVNPFLNREKLHVIYNSLDVTDWKPDEEYSFCRDGKIHIVIAASHRKLKNLIGLLEAMMMLEEAERQRLRVSWYGDGLDFPFFDDSIIYCREFIARNDIGSIVSLYPATTNIVSKMRAADVIGLFSFFEGLPNSICEGMAIGKPILASAVSDIPLIVEDGVSGKLFDPTKTESIVSAIRFFLKMELSRFSEMGRVNRLKALELFDSMKNTTKYFDLLQ